MVAQSAAEALVLLALLSVFSGFPTSPAQTRTCREITIDGDPTDWSSTGPLLLSSQNLIDEGAPRPVGDLREVYASYDSAYVCFLVRFWANVNFNTHPVAGERVTGLVVQLQVPNPESYVIELSLHPLWEVMNNHVLVDRNRDGNFDFQTEYLGTFDYAYRNEFVEGRVGLDLIGPYGFQDLQGLSARFNGFAWHPIPNGYGSVFDLTQWFSVPSYSEPVKVITQVVTTLQYSTTTVTKGVPFGFQSPLQEIVDFLRDFGRELVITILATALLSTVYRHRKARKAHKDSRFKFGCPHQGTHTHQVEHTQLLDSQN